MTAALAVALGVAYTLSPLTVLSLAVLAWAMHAGSRGLSAAERRWFWSLMSAAVVLRLAAIALLFLTADPARPFASFFGDEELYKFRTTWLRNIGQGIAMSPADVAYSFDAVGHTSYIYILAFVQALVGDAPYGLHVLNMTLYLCGTLAFYRLARAGYGASVAMAGLLVLLFLPTIAVWSISVLKEPMNVFMIAVELICAVAIVRAPRWWQKALAAGGVAGTAYVMESLRQGGFPTAVIGTVGGVLLVAALSRGRRLAFALVLVPAAIIILATTSAVQQRVLSNLREAAFYHAGHVLTPGHSYYVVDRRYYDDRLELRHMPAIDAGRFVASAMWSYVAEPVPWRTASPLLLAYLPEQLVWYLMALMVPFGVLAGMRRDLVLTSMLVTHAAGAIVLVALTSGNIGTLIRHRALALPYLVWLSALGAHECVRQYLKRSRVPVERGRIDDDR